MDVLGKRGVRRGEKVTPELVQTMLFRAANFATTAEENMDQTAKVALNRVRFNVEVPVPPAQVSVSDHALEHLQSSWFTLALAGRLLGQ